MPNQKGSKNRAAARQAAKNYRRALRKGGDKGKPYGKPGNTKVPKWMRGKPMMKFGSGGTDKGGKNRGRPAYYSDKPASR